MNALLLWGIPLLPLAGFLINVTMGKRLPKSAVGGIACLLPAGSFALSAWAAMSVFAGAGLTHTAFEWFSAGGWSVDFGLTVDRLSAVMILVVTGVGTLIHVYSVGYMHEDEDFARYFSYLNLFMSAMLVLVLADNLILMFVGWEGVGLCSYLLIGFWFHDLKNADAGKKAFIVNRVGDFGFILGSIFLFVLAGSFDFSELSGAIGRQRLAETGMLPLVFATPALLLFLGACGKSAQIPLYVWLPDAMAGPTPVSALIHAATMVTAGVYMIGRLHFLFAAVPSVLSIIVLVGSATAFFAAVIAVAQNDIKKILAYSTISQLGFMFAGMASTYFTTGIFHLVTHAFFKALLFLGAGAVIHALHGEQDIRKMGGLARSLPAVFITFGLGAFALMGCPGFAGYYSKDAILSAVDAYSWRANFGLSWYLLVGTAFLTAFYTTRMLVMVFFGAPADPHQHPHKPSLTMTIPLVLLALASVGGGFLLAPSFEVSHAPLADAMGALESGYSAVAYGQAHGRATVASWFAFGAGFLSAAFVYLFRRSLAQSFVEGELGRRVHRLVQNKFYVDEIYAWTIVGGLKIAAGLLWFVVDRILIDGLLVNGTARLAYAAGGLVRRAHTGAIAAGAGAILLGVLAGLAWLFHQFLRT